MTNRFVLAAAVAAIMSAGVAQAQAVHLPGGTVSSRIQAAVPAGLTSEADIQANLEQQLGAAGTADIKAYQRECGIPESRANGLLGGPKTRQCLTLQAQAIAQARAGAPPPTNAAPPTQAQVDALIFTNCGTGTQEFRGSDVILRCDDGRVFLLQPDQATCVASGAQLVCEWTATLDPGSGSAPPPPASGGFFQEYGWVVATAAVVLGVTFGSLCIAGVTCEYQLVDAPAGAGGGQ